MAVGTDRHEKETEMKHSATARWRGSVREGGGTLTTQSGAISNLPYTWKMRFENEDGQLGTNPEELIAAAHAGCFAMELSSQLTANGTPPAELNATASVEIIRGTGITGSAITLEAKVPGIDAQKFEELAQNAKANCPVSKALGAISVTLTAKLV
jgi:lipoyl-dependent peroxiredoxin